MRLRKAKDSSYNSHKKAQAAMEFLMTYGWAILVVLIAIAALYAMGVFSGGGATTCKLDAPFACDVAVSETGGVVTSNFAITAQGIGTGGSAVISGECTANIASVSNGETKSAITCAGVKKGQKIKGEVKVTYTLVGSTLSKTMTGTWGTTVAG